jgi:hypothetical protein
MPPMFARSTFTGGADFANATFGSDALFSVVTFDGAAISSGRLSAAGLSSTERLSLTSPNSRQRLSTAPPGSTRRPSTAMPCSRGRSLKAARAACLSRDRASCHPMLDMSGRRDRASSRLAAANIPLSARTTTVLLDAPCFAYHLMPGQVLGRRPSDLGLWTHHLQMTAYESTEKADPR